jgi:hypothetical protein
VDAPIVSVAGDESQNIDVDNNETDMLKLQSNQMMHKVYNLASDLLDLHQGQMNNMIHDIGQTLSNTWTEYGGERERHEMDDKVQILGALEAT